MNIFVLDTDPKLAASYHCDMHVVKMISESMQMLKVYANSILDKPKYFTKAGKPYKGYLYHQCTQWIFQSKAHFDWLVQLTKELNKVWCLRFNHYRDHNSINDLDELVELCTDLNKWPTCEHLNWAIAMPDKICSKKYIDDSKLAVTYYRRYYNEYKTHFASWAYGSIPEWWQFKQFPAGRAYCRLTANWFRQIDQVDLYQLINQKDTNNTYQLSESFTKKRKKKEPKPPTLAEKVRNHIKANLHKKIPRVSTVQKWIDTYGKDYELLIGIADNYIQDNKEL